MPESYTSENLPYTAVFKNKNIYNMCSIFFLLLGFKGPGGYPALHKQDLKTTNLGFVLSLDLGQFHVNSKLKLNFSF